MIRRFRMIGWDNKNGMPKKIISDSGDWIPYEDISMQAQCIKEMREALVLSEKAMNYMGDIINGCDMATEEDEIILNPAFESARTVLARWPE